MSTKLYHGRVYFNCMIKHYECQLSRDEHFCGKFVYMNLDLAYVTHTGLERCGIPGVLASKTNLKTVVYKVFLFGRIDTL